MNNLKQKITYVLEDKPWIKWAAGGGLLGLLLIVFLIVQVVRPRPDTLMDGDKLEQSLRVKFEDTGETMEVPIGFISRELITRPGQASEDWKLTNPKTGVQSGVVSERGAWADLVKQVNEHKAASAATPK